jgi:carboxyl-terminal processing protease
LTRYLIALSVAVSFVLGLTFPRTLLGAQGGLPERVLTSRPTPGGRDLDPFTVYGATLTELKDRFYGELPADPDRKLSYEAIRGMVRAVDDPYTQFLDPEEYRALHEDNEGEFVGIGAFLDNRKTKDGYVRIVRPLGGTPAQRAGIQKNDVILKVDGKPVNEIPNVDAVVKMIRGQPNTAVRLTIQRTGSPKPIEVRIVRQLVEVEVVQDVELKEGNVGYLFLSQFNQRADEKIEQAVKELETKGMKGLIIDLRGNPGGLLDVAVDIVSRFVPPRNNAVIIVRSGGEQEAKRCNPRKYLRPEYPIVVLVNHASASASEIVAGAFKDTGTGTIVGQTTFGKGLVQTVFPHPQDGSAVKITTHKYLTSKGHDINRSRDHRGGVEPDVTVDITEDDFTHGRDPQLDKALQILWQKLGYQKPAGASSPAPAPGQ